MGDILLVRHGQTPGNARGAYIGRQSDEHLSDEGISGLHNLKEIYDSLINNYGTIDIYSSPMIRCKETADILFPNMKPVIVDDLAEMDFGIFEGKAFPELDHIPEYQKWVDSECRDQIPEGEILEGFVNRCINGFTYAVKNSNADLKVIVCHGGTIMAIISEITGDSFYKHIPGNGNGVLFKNFELAEDEDGANILPRISTYDRIPS